MTYDEMYDVSTYLKENNITLDEKVINYLMGVDIDESEYFILDYDFDVIMKYFDTRRVTDIRIFLENVVLKNIPTEELIYFINLILIQDTWEKRDQMRQACENDEIRENKELLWLISSQGTWDKMERLREACEFDTIRENKEWLWQIAIQKSPEEQEALINEYLERIENKEVIRLQGELNNALSQNIETFRKVYEQIDSSLEDVKYKTIEIGRK